MRIAMIRTVGHALLGVTVFVVLCEALCRALPVSSATKVGYHVDPAIQTYAPRHDWRYATGWDLRNSQSLRTNNMGFVSPHDFVRDAGAVAIVGDSYIESASLDAADRPGAQLERALGNHRAVYAIGSPGAALLDHAERIRFAHERFGVRDFVVLVERSDLLQSVCGAGGGAGQCLDPRTLEVRTVIAAQASALKRLLRHSAFAQYLASQLKIDPSALWRKAFASAKPAQATGSLRQPGNERERGVADEGMRRIEAVTRAFLERVQPYALGRLVLVVDSDRRAMAQGQPSVDAQRLRFIELARAANAVVVDTEPVFRAHFDRSALSLDIGPYDAHLNPIGVRLMVGAAANALQQ